MPFSFADALKKPSVPKPDPPEKQPQPPPKEQSSSKKPSTLETSSWSKIGQKPAKAQYKQPQKPNHSKTTDKKTNKRPPQSQTHNTSNGSNGTKQLKTKSKKPKPNSSDRGSSDATPKQLLTRQPVQLPPALDGQDFPSLGETPKLPSSSTWGKETTPVVTPVTPRVISPAKHQFVVAAKHKTQSLKQGTVIAKPTLSGPVRKEKKKEPKRKEPEVSSLLATFGAKQRSEEEKMGLGKFLKDVSDVKKGRQRLKPRKKKFSTLKKKVLQERLNQWRNLQQTTQSTKPATTSATTVALWNYCRPEELEDEEEMQEIVENLRDMGSKVGGVKDLHLNRGHAFILFDESDLAQAAQVCWNGVTIGGDRLDVELLANLPSEETWRKAVEACQRNEEQNSNDVISELILENILTQDDLDDEECLQESLEDIRAVAVNLGNLVNIRVQNRTQVVLTYQGTEKASQYFEGQVFGGQVVSVRLQDDSTSSVVLTNVLTEDDFEDDECLEESLNDLRVLASQFGTVTDISVRKDQDWAIVVKYEGNSAQSAVASLNGQLIGGQKIQAHLLLPKAASAKHFMTLQNVLTEDDLEDEDCLEETKEDLVQLAGQFGSVTKIEVDIQAKVVKIEYEAELSIVTSTVKHFNGMVIGGKTVVATLESDGDEEIMVIEESTSNVATQEDETLVPLYSGGKLIAERFAECKRAPKIANLGTPRKYASLINDEAVKPLLAEMLGELMRLQKRALEQKNTKAKRRMVMGLREVARGIRSHKVKLVVMANNLDEYGAIDDKLQEIIDLAREESVPIFYEFNKRGLGKAIGKNIKIGVVGVQNAEGSHQEFKKLMSLANKHGAY